MDCDRILNSLSMRESNMITTKAAEEAGISRAMLSHPVQWNSSSTRSSTTASLFSCGPTISRLSWQKR